MCADLPKRQLGAKAIIQMYQGHGYNNGQR